MRTSITLASLAAFRLVTSQAVGFCKDDECSDCPSSITTAGTGYPECVVYDTETVLGGQGYPEGAGGDLLYEIFGNFPDPGPSCTTIIRSPATITDIGCGNLQFRTNTATCSSGIQLQDTFLVQFCCGEGDCTAAGVPFKRGIAGHTARAAGGLQGVYLKFANGTIIPPKEVGHAPTAEDIAARSAKKALSGEAKRQSACASYDNANYVADGEPYLKTFDTQILTATLGPFPEDTTISRTYEQSTSRTTSFSTSVGDPFGIVSVTVGFEFTDTQSSGVQYDVPVSAGTSGQIGFTPVFRCTSGTLSCDGGSESGETCTGYTLDGVVQGDYTLVQG